MFLIRFFRFLRGYVIFTCTGGFPERFINLCSLSGINLWDAKSSCGVLTAKTTAEGYKRIRQCATKSGMKTKLIKKCGFPFFIRPYKKRKGIAAGVAVAVLMIAYFSSTVWTIEVSGNERFTKEQIIEIAADYGVYPGAFRRNIDIKKIRSRVKSEISGISWFSVNIDGTHVSLEVSETSGTNEIVDRTTPCNIVSGVDGELLKLDCYTGMPVVKPGSAVTKGDLLISGVEEKTDGSAYFVHAKGTAVVRTDKNITVSIPHNINVIKTDRMKQRYVLSIFGAEIPFSLPESADIHNQSRSFLTFRNRILPVGILTDRYFYQKAEQMNLTENQTVLLAIFRAFMQETEIMKNSVTENKTVQLFSDSDSAKVVIDYVNHEKTGMERYFEIDTKIN